MVDFVEFTSGGATQIAAQARITDTAGSLAPGARFHGKDRPADSILTVTRSVVVE